MSDKIRAKRQRMRGDKLMATQTKRTAPQSVKVTVDAALDASEIIALRDEMAEWRDNLAGASMEHLPKYEEVSECADALDDVADEIERSIDDLTSALGEDGERGERILSLVVMTYKATKERARAGRAKRLGYATREIRAACESINVEYEPEKERHAAKAPQTDDDRASDSRVDDVLAAVEEVLSHCDTLDDVSFPGMY